MRRSKYPPPPINSMLDHLPLYEGNQRIGRITRIVGCRIELSTAPVATLPSKATGYLLVPVTVPEGWVHRHGAEAGHWLSIAQNGWLTLHKTEPMLELIEEPTRLRA